MRRPPLHPACKIFPALGREELQELADDIAANGLRNPIVMYEGSRIGFQGSLRFGVDRSGPITKGQSMTATNGVARCPDFFVAGVGETQEAIDHPAVFPVSLAEQLILTFSREGELVLDPFCGSGSGLCGAKRTNRAYLGFDTNADYVKIARERLTAQ